MGADTNLFSSIGCGEECRRRCLVSVVGHCFVRQCVCLLTWECVFSFDLLQYICWYTFDSYSSKTAERCQDQLTPEANVKLVLPTVY